MAVVMIVEDSPTDALNLKTILQKAGHTVIEVNSGSDAVARARSDKPDCVVMDVVMPGMNGFQATRMLSRDPETSSIPVIVCSAKNQETDRVWAMRQGAREYLVKPVKEGELLSRIRTVLGS